MRYGASPSQHRISRFTTNAEDSCEPNADCHSKRWAHLHIVGFLQPQHIERSRLARQKNSPSYINRTRNTKKDPPTCRPQKKVQTTPVPFPQLKCQEKAHRVCNLMRTITVLDGVHPPCPWLPWRFSSACAPECPPSLWEIADKPDSCCRVCTYVCKMPAPVREHLAAPPGLLLTPALYYAHPPATRWAVLLMGHLIQPNIAPPRGGWQTNVHLCMFGVLTTHMRLRGI